MRSSRPVPASGQHAPSIDVLREWSSVETRSTPLTIAPRQPAYPLTAHPGLSPIRQARPCQEPLGPGHGYGRRRIHRVAFFANRTVLGSDRLRVEDIESKRMQLLTTHSLQLVTVQPKPGEIIVSIAGEKRHAVSLWDVWARRELKRNASGINTSFVLGLQELNGNVLYLNLGGDFGGLSQHEPHSLVAGATGSGKSVLIQSLLLDIAATNPSNLARIVLIDPKMGVDYAALEALPHLREPIITTQGRAIEVLKALVEEMDQRYRQFAEVRARDLPTFNSKVAVDRRLAMIVLVHDEFADWMLDDNYKGVVSAAVARLGVKARAAGIHLVFAAQRPDKDVMPMQLRENLGNRLILKVASEATSKIALDRPGAELLLGKGHLAAKLAGEQGLLFGQAPFLSDTDIEQAAAAIAADNTTSPD